MENMHDAENGLDKTTVSRTPDAEKKAGIRMDGPDGGRAWIVALATCMINFIMAGLGRASGILYLAYMVEFQVGRKEASTPSSLRSSIRNLLGPIVGILGQKYGIRAVIITGGVIGTLSAILCFFAPDIMWITILWGGLNGVGSALTVILPQVVIGQYFVKHRTTASGIAFSGGCVGSFIFPIILEHYILNTGIEGTFLIMAGIIMNTIPAAMILRRPPWLKNGNEERVAKVEVEQKETISPPFDSIVRLDENKDSGIHGMCCLSQSSPKDSPSRKDPMNNPDIHFLRQNSDLVVKILTIKSPADTLSTSLETCEPVYAIEFCILEELEDMFRCLQYSGAKVQFYRNLRLGEDLFCSMEQMEGVKSINGVKTRSLHTDTRFKHGFGRLFKASSAPDVSKISKEISNNYVLQKMKDLLTVNGAGITACFPEENKRKIFKILRELRKLYNASAHFDKRAVRESTNVPQQLVPSNGKSRKVHANGFLDHLKTAFKLHVNPLFLLVCLCRAAHFINFIPIMTTVVDFVIDKGLERQDGNYAIGAISLGDLIGRLCLGWVTDRGYMSMSKYMMVVMVLQGASTASLPLMHGKVSIFVTLAIFGMLEGSLFVRHPVLVSKYMKDHEQSIGMGCINFFSGILGFGIPAYIGYFRDTRGSYDYIFYINGLMGALIGLIWSLEPYFLRCLAKKDSDEPEAPV